MNETPRLDPARDSAIRAAVMTHARSTVRPRRGRRILLVASIATAAVVVVGGIAVGATRHSVSPGPGGVAVPSSASRAPSASPAPTPTTAPGDLQQAGPKTPTPVPDPLSQVDTIRLDAESLVLLDHGATTETVTMRQSTAGAVAQLTRLLGAPTVTRQTAAPNAGACGLDQTIYDWGGALRLFDGPGGLTATTPDFDVRLLKSTLGTAVGTTVALQAPGGIHVGQDIAQQIAAAPAADKQDDSFPGRPVAWSLRLQTGWRDPTATTDVVGVAAFTNGTVVTTIGTPVAVPTDGDC